VATNVGVATVPDPRLIGLREHYQPKRFTPATVTYVDLPGIQKGGTTESLDFTRLRQVDALAHVVRAFTEPTLLHAEGSVDPVRDVEIIDLELILEIVERRLDRLNREAKQGLSADDQRQRTLLSEEILPALEEERPLRSLDLADDDRRRLKGFQLLSAKPLLLIVNVDESAVGDNGSEGAEIPPRPGVRIVTISAPIEEEISHLDADDQTQFLADLGLTEPSLDRVIRASYELLGLISFFTVGEDEVRAWTVRRDITARQAGGTIHSDIERGFIRAEVVAWSDLLRLASLAACRDEGILRLEGKEYPVQDGEIVHFRFNV
jgi:GTP-binding protein YchF